MWVGMESRWQEQNLDWSKHLQDSIWQELHLDWKTGLSVLSLAVASKWRNLDMDGAGVCGL